MWVPDYTVGDGLGTRIARGLWKLGFKQTPGCGCPRVQTRLDRWTTRPRRTLPPISGGAATEEAVCSSPDVIFCDNFNDRTLTSDIRTSGNMGQSLGGKTFGWGFDQTPGQGITNVGCLEGNCFSQLYPDLSTPQMKDNGGGGFMGTPSFAQTRTAYYRIWLKYPSNWVESPNGSKIIYAENDQGFGPRNEILGARSNPPFPIAERAFVNNVEQRVFPNMNLSAANFNLGNWMCLEVRWTHESALGVNDGYWQAWVNDVQVAEYPNIRWNGSSETNTSGRHYTDYLLSSYYNCQCDPSRYPCNNNATACIDPQNAHPQMVRLSDRVVISRERIGCSGGIIIPPSPPPTPATFIAITQPTSNPTYISNRSPL
jgi:hypothetical protein